MAACKLDMSLDDLIKASKRHKLHQPGNRHIHHQNAAKRNAASKITARAVRRATDMPNAAVARRPFVTAPVQPTRHTPIQFILQPRPEQNRQQHQHQQGNAKHRRKVHARRHGRQTQEYSPASHNTAHCHQPGCQNHQRSKRHGEWQQQQQQQNKSNKKRRQQQQMQRGQWFSPHAAVTAGAKAHAWLHTGRPERSAGVELASGLRGLSIQQQQQQLHRTQDGCVKKGALRDRWRHYQWQGQRHAASQQQPRQQQGHKGPECLRHSHRRHQKTYGANGTACT